MKRSELIKIVKDYLDLCEEDTLLHPTTEEKAEYIVSGCFETFTEWSPDEQDS